MGAFDELLAADASIFVDDAGSPEVESVVYTPRGGEAKTITVQVFRGETRRDPVGRRVKDLRIVLPRNATTHVGSVNVGGDRVAIAGKKGETPKVLTVAEIVQEDAGMFDLRLE